MGLKIDLSYDRKKRVTRLLENMRIFGSKTC
jgi:hypothetical protein